MEKYEVTLQYPDHTTKTVYIVADSHHQAEQEAKQTNPGYTFIYSAKQISNWSSNSSSLSGLGSGSGTTKFVLFFIALGLFVSFADYVLLFLGGTVGYWIGKKYVNWTNKKETSNSAGIRFLDFFIIFGLSATLGALGFQAGTNIKDSVNDDSAYVEINNNKDEVGSFRDTKSSNKM